MSGVRRAIPDSPSSRVRSGSATAAVRGAVQALAGVDLALPRGTFTAVMKPPGSTFLRRAAGLDRPTSGSVRAGGTEITGTNELTQPRRGRLGVVFQAFTLPPSLTVEQNVLLPQRLAGRRQSSCSPWAASTTGPPPPERPRPRREVP